MRSRLIRGLLTTVVLAAAPLSWTNAASSGCSDLTDADKTRLISYVKKKYQIPDNAKIGIQEASPLLDKCYRKVLFSGTGPLGVISLGLYLSPDLRFLSPELFDSSVDPDREREEKARKAMIELNKGEFASIGNASAPVNVVVFSDFECPFCKQAAEILRAEPLIRNAKDVRLVFRHMPLSGHQWAQQAAQVAACAQFQSGVVFWALHDALFLNQSTITQENVSEKVTALAASIPTLDQTKFKECVDRQMSLGVVLRDKDLATHSGVTGTPTIFVNGRIIPGIGNAAEFHKLLENAIQDQRTALAKQ